jgi:hypothetical protein
MSHAANDLLVSDIDAYLQRHDERRCSGSSPAGVSTTGRAR